MQTVTICVPNEHFNANRFYIYIYREREGERGRERAKINSSFKTFQESDITGSGNGIHLSRQQL